MPVTSHDRTPYGGPPHPDVTVPAGVAAAAAGQPVRVNEAGGLTFEAGEGATRCFIKWIPAGSGLDLTAEAERLSWAVAFL
jgi:kanamycin kinase